MSTDDLGYHESGCSVDINRNADNRKDTAHIHSLNKVELTCNSFK